MSSQMEMKETANGLDELEGIFWVDASVVMRDGKMEVGIAFYGNKWIMTLEEAMELYANLEEVLDMTQGIG